MQANTSSIAKVVIASLSSSRHSGRGPAPSSSSNARCSGVRRARWCPCRLTLTTQYTLSRHALGVGSLLKDAGGESGSTSRIRSSCKACSRFASMALDGLRHSSPVGCSAGSRRSSCLSIRTSSRASSCSLRVIERLRRGIGRRLASDQCSLMRWRCCACSSSLAC
ncbi:hypothetical protein D3C79_536060 [compost metagenome]